MNQRMWAGSRISLSQQLERSQNLHPYDHKEVNSVGKEMDSLLKLPEGSTILPAHLEHLTSRTEIS